MGTIGGNVALDTRCVYYNQPAGWRTAIGGCLKADGTVCHVAPKGSGCYAAHSADTIPVLWLYDAVIFAASSDGTREIPVRALATDDGRVPGLRPGELIVSVRVPARAAPVVHRKLRTRGAIDYGLLLVAVTLDEDGFHAVISATGPRPVEVHGRSAVELAEAAYSAVQPLGTHLASVPWRKKMVRVEVRRAAEAL
jgi:4-hydroxybenzoyl-CoA reductase subunit beta